MPIHVPEYLRRMDQEEFGKLAYDVTRCAFQIHRELGRFFAEDVYQREMARSLTNAHIESPVTLVFDNLLLERFIDLVVEGAIFELKAAESFHDRHLAQILNYLLLAEHAHGKIINFQPEQVEHQFVNTSLRHGDRAAFSVDCAEWADVEPSRVGFQKWFVELLRDWGAGLDLALYEEAASHFYHGTEPSEGVVSVLRGERVVAQQPIRLAAAQVALRITAIDAPNLKSFSEHLRRFLDHTSLEAIQWINVRRDIVTFKSLRK
jgi:GxxExxY protein